MTSERASIEDLGPNAGLVDEMYRLYVENPNAVSEGWRDFFADYQPNSVVKAPTTPGPATPPAAAPAAAPAAQPAPAPAAAPGAPVTLDGETPELLRGAAASVARNMEASLAVPTATSV